MIIPGQAVNIECPECGEHIEVPLRVDIAADGDWLQESLIIEPDMADLWAHVSTHTPEVSNG